MYCTKCTKNSKHKFKKLMELYSSIETLFNILLFLITSCSYFPRFYGYVGQGSSLYWCKALDILDQNPSIFWYVVVDILVQGNRYFGFTSFDILVLRCFGMPPVSSFLMTLNLGRTHLTRGLRKKAVSSSDLATGFCQGSAFWSIYQSDTPGGGGRRRR